ncbi:hypothetical protein OUZ56_012191 [Daphnia magna]|uniref:Uncharacterized protein n=1 Tax=Daphnia magna TaxID=35525 RepID=A0ABQ9Z2A8_9CRUS|nr:hypothetical protein OUZ56_012191 [Daphnia magna]
MLKIDRIVAAVLVNRFQTDPIFRFATTLDYSTVKKVGLHHYFGVNCPKNSANEIWGSQPRKLCIVSQYEIFGLINPKFVGFIELYLFYNKVQSYLIEKRPDNFQIAQLSLKTEEFHFPIAAIDQEEVSNKNSKLLEDSDGTGVQSKTTTKISKFEQLFCERFAKRKKVAEGASEIGFEVSSYLALGDHCDLS